MLVIVCKLEQPALSTLIFSKWTYRPPRTLGQEHPWRRNCLTENMRARRNIARKTTGRRWEKRNKSGKKDGRSREDGGVKFGVGLYTRASYMPSNTVILWLHSWIVSGIGNTIHPHHVMPLARISLTLSRHFSLSFIASGSSSGLHLVSSHRSCMYVRAGHPAFAWP